jgi:GTP-binding protein EngB required for normal cell division/Flp pilus assembly protein TadD
MSLLDRAARFIDDVLLLPDDIRDTLEQAEHALEHGVPEHAEPLFREVLAARPSLLRARQGLALTLEARGDLAGARAILVVSRQLDPDEPEIALLSARLALAAGDLEAAVEDAREAARRLAQDGGAPFAEACLVRARAEQRRGRPDRAARELRKAIAAAPDDVTLRVELAEALAAAGRGAQAAAIARQVKGDDVDPETAARLGLALHRAGEGARARPLLERAAVAGRADALGALAALCLAAGDARDGEQHARMAVARGGGAEALATLAEVLHALGRDAEASQALLTASDARGGDPELLRRAIRIVPLEQASELAYLADRLEALAPGDEAARAAWAWSELAHGRASSAAALVGAPQPGPREPRLALAAARLAVDAGRAQEALELLSRTFAWGAADLLHVRGVRRDALRALWLGTTGEVDLAAAIDEVARFAKQRALDDAHRRALALRDELDRPLLLAILGEFNAGKSTLVNAFVGADVAPTGILPTTATLNVLRGGAERRVRVVRKDGTTREGSYAELKQMLAEAEGEGVDHVEIMLPSELLERVWILDTPGSNAPLPEHEALAAEALRRADAALWIFDAGQAGKASEGKILQAIRASRRHVVAAVNKVDRLAEGQLEQVRESLKRELPELGAPVVALSARRALKARLASDEEGWQASGFPGLLERLETDVFGRSRQLKRRACGARLLAVIEDALATEEGAAAAHELRAAELERAAGPIAAAAGKLTDAIDEALALLERTQVSAFDAAAEEVLAFVRPRTNRFAKHGTDPEDRAFLADVIEGRLATATRGCEARLVSRVRGILAEPTAMLGLDAPALDAQVRAALGPAMARFAGYQSGLLAGGALRRFFDEDLPRAELVKETLAEALAATRAHPTEALKPILADALSDLATSLERDRTAAIALARAEGDRVRDHVYEPLRALREVLEELVD